jgi:hypothetical protein
MILVAACGRFNFDDRTGATGDSAGSSSSAMPPGPFQPATLITTFVSGAAHDDPAISPDGLELYVATTMGGASEDLYVSTRTTRDTPWSALSKVAELSSDSIGEKAPELTGDGRVMYYVSGFDIMRAQRAAVGAPWSATQTGLSGSYGTPTVCDDERTMFMRVGDDGFQDLVVSRRTSKASPWPTPVLVPELNDVADEGGPWVTPDCGRIYFDSDRRQRGVLYSADRIPGTDTYGPPTELAAYGNMLDNTHDASFTADERILVFAHKVGGIDEVWETRR